MLEIANLLNLEKLQKATIKKAQEVAATLFSSAEVLALSADSLVSILRRGHLNIDSELQLINAALGWASNRCEQRDISTEGKALRSVLEEVGAFKHLRFLNLTPQELQTFETDPNKRDVLTAGEIIAIRKHHYSINDEPPPDSVCNLSKPRDYSLSVGHHVLHIREGKSLNEITAHETVTEKLDYLDIGPATFYGVTIATQVGESDHGYYEEELRVNVSYGPGNKSDISGYFKGFVKYKDEVTVPLERRGKSFDDRMSVKITFCKSGIYPVFQNLDKCQHNAGHIIKLHYS